MTTVGITYGDTPPWELRMKMATVGILTTVGITEAWGPPWELQRKNRRPVGSAWAGEAGGFVFVGFDGVAAAAEGLPVGLLPEEGVGASVHWRDVVDEGGEGGLAAAAD